MWTQTSNPQTSNDYPGLNEEIDFRSNVHFNAESSLYSLVFWLISWLGVLGKYFLNDTNHLLPVVPIIQSAHF